MRTHYFFSLLVNYGYLLLIGCLVLTGSCNTPSQKIGLPLGSTYDGGYSGMGCDCPLKEELHNFDMVPEKIKFQTRMALLKYMEQDEIDLQLEFVSFKSYAERPKLEKDKLKYCGYSMHY